MPSSQILPFSHLDDNEFALALYEFHNGPVHYDHDRLVDLAFNPLISTIDQHLTCSDDLDPDLHFNTNSRCDYFNEDKLNNILSKDGQSDSNFSLLHLNVRSLRNKVDYLTLLLANLKINFTIIGISETWLQNDSHDVDMIGYEFIHKNRPDRSGGGVGLYLSNNCDFKVRDDLSGSDADVMESLFIEIVRSNEKNIVVGVIYRPPNTNVDAFMSKHCEIVEKLSRENKLFYLMGDFNLNLLNHGNHLATGEFMDGLYSCTFFPLITLPSRITSHSATLVDNIFTNHLTHNYLRAGLLLSDISDHLPVFSICPNSDNETMKSCSEAVFVRDKSSANMDKFLENLQNVNWSHLNGYAHPQHCYSSFVNKYTEIYDNCFPYKKIKRSDRRLSKPWISLGLLKSIKKKNKLYKQYLSNTSNHSEVYYKRYKNKLIHSLRVAKRLYYDKKLEESKSNVKATWRLLNEVINRTKVKFKLNSTFKKDGQENCDPMVIADKFCQYFTNIGPNLAMRITSTVTSSHTDYLSRNFPQSIFFNSATEEEIINIASSFKPGKAAGHDKISMSTIKQSIHCIATPLTHIINLSIAHGVVPRELKIARVVPIFKSGDQTLFTNYRPISVLPCFSKFLERIIYNRILLYLNKFNILYASGEATQLPLL